MLFIGVVFLNILGTLILVGGSAWSAYRFIRDRAGIDRVICNVLLIGGALIIAVGFSAAKTVGIGNLDVLGAYEAAGIAIMFAGFLALAGLEFATRRRLHPGPRPRNGLIGSESDGLAQHWQ